MEIVMTPWKILWLSGAGLIPMLMSALLAWAAPQPGAMDDIQICYGRFEDSTIAACTRAIGSSKFNGREIAKLYNNRGFEYYVKRDHDRAIADHNKAIEIDPKYA